MLQSAQIKREARALGFSACGLAPAAPVSAVRAAEFRRSLAEGLHGEMEYLARNVEKRLDPRQLVEGARTVVSLAVNYYPGDFGDGTPGDEAGGMCDETADFGGQSAGLSDETAGLRILSPKLPDETADFRDRVAMLSDETAENGEEHRPNAWRLARYAYGDDYHDVVKAMLRALMQRLGLEEGVDGRAFVDTAPVDEKYWAQQAGLGWRGRHSQLILPGAGSYFFLGELVLVHPADRYDTPADGHCGSCRRCVEACPTGALPGDGTLDARRCLSYLTIEHRGALPEEAGEKLAPCFYGCDRCAEACPWNVRFARPTEVEALRPRSALLGMTPADWRGLTVERYRELFKGSAVKRAKFDGLKRNLAFLESRETTPE